MTRHYKAITGLPTFNTQFMLGKLDSRVSYAKKFCVIQCGQFAYLTLQHSTQPAA